MSCLSGRYNLHQFSDALGLVQENGSFVAVVDFKETVINQANICLQNESKENKNVLILQATFWEGLTLMDYVIKLSYNAFSEVSSQTCP